MNFKEIVNERFLRKQQRIKKINTTNINSESEYKGRGVIILFCSIILISFINTNYLSIDEAVTLTFTSPFLFVFLFIFFRPKNIDKISDKLNKKEYKILLNKSQYIIFNNKLKKCNYNEFLDNQKIIFKYIETLPLHQQQNSLNIINEKINLNENLIKNTKRIVEEQVKQKDNINPKSKVLLKNI